MSNTEMQIMEQVGKVTERMTDLQKEKMLAFGEGMAAAMNIINPQKESA